MLAGHQLHKAAGLTQAGDTSGNLAQGPIKDVISALMYYGWKMEQAHIRINEEGWDLDLSIGSRSMLKHYLVLAHDNRTYTELEQQLRDRGAWKHSEAIKWEVIRKFLFNGKIKHTHTGALLNLITNIVPTQAWL